MFILIVVLVFLGPTPTVGETKQGYTALSFGRTIEDYIQFRPGDMSPFAGSFTLCAWMKKLHTAPDSIVFAYYPGIINIGDTGIWNYVRTKHLNLRGKFPGTNVWFHYCLSWAAGGAQRVYVNGVLVGITAAVSWNLELGGTICLGNAVAENRSNNKYSDYIFGGELYKLNMFSEQLTSSQIREMAYSGMCSAVEEKYETRQLKWEQILTKQRQGNVRDIDLRSREIECASRSISELERRLTEAENEFSLYKKTCRNTQRRLNR